MLANREHMESVFLGGGGLLDYINFALWLILNLTSEPINENKQVFFLEQIYVWKTKVGLFCYLNVDI